MTAVVARVSAPPAPDPGSAPDGSDAAPGATPGAWLRRALPYLVIAAALVLLGIAASPRSQGAPLDPNGTGPQGAKALLLLLRQYGARVDVVDSVPGTDVAVAVVLTDQLDDARRAGIGQWVRNGGILVVADPRSPLQIGVPTLVSNGLTTQDLHPQGLCPLLSGSGIVRLSVGPSALLRRLPRNGGTRTCFAYPVSGGDDAFFLLSRPVGRGMVVALGGAGLWTNQRLDQDDNAALAVRLLAAPGSARRAVLVPSKAGSGHRSAVGLLSPRVRTGLLQLMIAFGVLAWWRGRRLGRPVAETEPVRLAGSEIVAAVGDLLARTTNRDAAAHQLRDGARRWLGERLGLGSAAPPDQVADAASTRAGIDRARAAGLLSDAPLPDEAALVRLAQSLARLRQEVRRGHTP